MTANGSAPSTRPIVRRPPAPSDQEATVTRLNGDVARPGTPVPVAEVQGTLALDLHGCMGLPRTPELRVVADEDGRADHGVGAADGVYTWASRFAQAVVEILGGDRPVHQLVRWTTSPVYLELDQRVRRLNRAAPAHQRLRTIRPQVRSVHVFRPSPGAAEVSVHVRHGQRSRALAARLELVEGHWQCTALELG